MNNKTIVTNSAIAASDKAADISKQELDELHRDMRQAKLMHWITAHKQGLMTALVVLIIALVASSVLIERAKSQRAQVAQNYIQAISMQGSNQISQQKAALNTLVQDYPDSIYAAFSLWQLSVVDEEAGEKHLRQLLAHPLTAQELKKQTHLDLAAWYIRHDQADKAKVEIKLNLGEAYEELRQYLLAEASSDKEEKITHYQAAFNAKSYSDNLHKKIEAKLHSLGANIETVSAASQAE
ncbi:MAG: tetratricopeptide repeat protein [Mariprofundales bacterium]